MRLFENKVGRPSNEVIMKRRTFYLVVAALVVSLVGVATYAIIDLGSTKLKGSIFDSLKSKGTVKVQKPSNASFSQAGDKAAKYIVTNNTNKSVFYRWFTYSSTSTLTKYLGFVQDGCGEVPKGKTYTMSPTLQVSSKNPNRAGKMKVYKNKEACLKDNKGSRLESLYGSYVVKYKYSGKEEPTTTSKAANLKTTMASNKENVGVDCTDKTIYKGTTYSLTDAQKKKIAAMIYGEYDNDLVGMKAVASHMANLYEKRKKSGYAPAKNNSFYNFIILPAGCSGCKGWYASYKETYSSYKSLALKAVEDVLINGNRTLPPYIDEFDWFPGDIVTNSTKQKECFKQGGKKCVITSSNANNYVKDKTFLSNIYGSEGTFWCITRNDHDANIFYYTRK